MRSPYAVLSKQHNNTHISAVFPLSISRRTRFLNFLSFDDQVTMVATELIINEPASAIQKLSEPNIACRKTNKNVDRIIVPMKVPMIIYNA